MFVMADVFVDEFNVEESDSEKGNKKSVVKKVKQRNTIQWNCCRVLTNNLKLRLPRSLQCCCCKPKGKEKRMLKSYRRLEKELTISNLIRQVRLLKKLTQGKLGSDFSWSK